jgi:hypothetical protein
MVVPMKDSDPNDTPSAGLISVGEARAMAFVWSTWSASLLTAVVFIAAHKANVPKVHDFDMIPALTGNEPVTLRYLWAPAAEHRMLLPKLVIVVLGKLTHCDFRAEKFFHVACLGALSLAMMLTARRLRGRTSIVDVFFPLLLLSVGNCATCLVTLAHVLEGVIPCLALAVVLVNAGNLTWKSTVLFGTCLLVLPLCGSGAVAYVPAFVFVLLSAAVIRIRSGTPGMKRDAGLMFGFAAAAVCLVVLYFHGLEPRDLPRQLPSVGSNFFGFFAMSVGAGGRYAWQAVSAMVLLFVVLAAGVLVRRLFSDTRNRLRAFALLGFLSSTVVVAFAVAWSRACLGPGAALAYRFTVLATPVLCAAFFAFQLCERRSLGLGLQIALLALVIVVFPRNVQLGMQAGGHEKAVSERVLRDVRRGVEPSRLAARNRGLFPFQVPQWTAKRLEMLMHAEIEPFGPQYREMIRTRGQRASNLASHPTVASNANVQHDPDYRILPADDDNEERIVCPNGAVVQVRRDLKFGSVGRVFLRRSAVVCKGWAADVAEGVPVDSVLIFIDGQCGFRVDMASDGVPRPNVGKFYRKPHLKNVGFDMSLPPACFAGVGPENVRFIAVRGDVAAELKRSEDFWKIPADSALQQTAKGNVTSRR